MCVVVSFVVVVMQLLSIQHVDKAIDPTVKLGKLVKEDKLEEAFHMALSADDVDVVAWLCNQVRAVESLQAGRGGQCWCCGGGGGTRWTWRGSWWVWSWRVGAWSDFVGRGVAPDKAMRASVGK